MSLKKKLSEPHRYLDQIDRLHEKYLLRNQLYELKQDDVSFASVCLDRKRFSRILAETVSSGKYELTPATTRWITVNNKRRKLYAFCLTDLIMHGVVSNLINDSVNTQLSDSLYSYRKGKHWWGAISDLAAYTRKHCSMVKEVKSRGLYVIRRDVSKYTDSIPVGPDSLIWVMLKDILKHEPEKNKLAKQYWQMIEKIIRPEIYSEDSLLYSNTYGVATGSPISTSIFNIYLLAMDNALSYIPGAFYARYSDDILFAHPDHRIVRAANDRIDNILADLSLSTNKDKDLFLFFNGAARPSIVWPEATGASSIGFLGCDINFSGVISLQKHKVKVLLSEIDMRTRRTFKTLNNKNLDNAGPIICAVINNALDPSLAGCQKSASLVRKAITSRPQLKQLDYQIAKNVIRLLTGNANVRSFRTIKYRTLRQDWRLISLLHSRNRQKQRT